MFEAVLQDVRHGMRHLVRSPGFTVAALLTLALGIGANTAMFSLLNALLLRPLPIKDPYGLIAVSGRSPQQQMRPTPILAVDELSGDDSPLRDVCAYNGGEQLSIAANNAPARAVGAIVSGRCFDLLGVAPILGRTINVDDAPLYSRGNHVAVISHQLWQRAFGGDPSVIGKPVWVEGTELIVIGVMPKGFVGINVDFGIDLFAPYDTWSPARTDRRPNASYLLGRLKPDVSFEQASERLTARWPALLDRVVAAGIPAAERQSLLNARPQIERFATGLSFDRERYAQSLLLMSGLTVILLVLTCVNLGGLLLSRAIARGPEMSMRLALGGSRWRLARQILVENVMLSVAGAVLAVPAGMAIVAGLVSFLPPATIERSMSFTPDRFVLLVTAATAVTAGALMSLLPIAVAAPHTPSIASSARTVAGAGRWARAMLAVQVALAIVLVAGAGLLGRSLYLLQDVDLGVRSEGVLMVSLHPAQGGYRGMDNASYYPPLLDRISALPGVRSVSMGRIFPRLTGEFNGFEIAPLGEEAGDRRAMWEVTSPDHFATIGIPLLGGRLTSWSDNQSTPHVAVVSKRLADLLAPGGHVIGRHVRFSTEPFNRDVEIVGVVGNATIGNPRQVDVPVFYRPALQVGTLANNASLFIRADAGAHAALFASVPQLVAEGGREFVGRVDRLDDVLQRAPARERMSATLAVMLAGLAIVLAFVGVFALLAYSVSRRTREMGVRTAIGADPASVVWLVMRDGVVLTAIGVVAGLPAAYFGARLLSTLMFGVSPADPLTFGLVAVFFMVLSLAAGIVPARRAARVDPVIALRTE